VLTVHRCQPAVCPTGTANREAAARPKCPDVGRTAALSMELQAEGKCMKGSVPRNRSPKEFI